MDPKKHTKKEEDTTHFGYQRVPVSEKGSKVSAVFDSVANKYDLMNDLMSFGVHRLWKRIVVDIAQVRKGERVLDLASGTGDLAERLVKCVGAEGRVVLADINASMLKLARDRLTNVGIVSQVDYVISDAQALPFPNDYFDCATIGFGLRNVTDKSRALGELHRVLKPGGRCLILEFSKPILPGLKSIYDIYSFNILPRLGKLIADDADSYRYLAESIRMHPDQKKLKAMMQAAGFEGCDYHNLTGGIVAVHRGYKS